MSNEIEVKRRLLDVIDHLSAVSCVLDQPLLSSRLSLIEATVTDSRLRIGVLGDFGNGKSTLINSLVGAALLPMGAAPITRASARINPGPETRASLVYEDGARLDIPLQDLAGIPQDQVCRLRQLDVQAPASLLGLATFMDVSNLGAEERALDSTEWLTESDCVLFVLNCDRLLSLTELNFIRDTLAAAGIQHIAFVLNRCDGKNNSDIEALMDRAQHLLQPFIPDAPIFPYSALRSLQNALEPELESGEALDPRGLKSYIEGQWLPAVQSIKAAAASRKLQAMLTVLRSRIADNDAEQNRELLGRQSEVDKLAGEVAALEDELESTCKRITGGMEGVQEQLVVGMKQFALQMREGIPRELRPIAVEEIRRFLPFYIQASLRRAVEDNRDSVRRAVEELLQALPGDTSEETLKLLEGFSVDVEPPAIPLYVPRERAPLAQGATFMMVAACPLAMTNFYVALFILSNSFLSWEIGRRLEAGDRRASLASSAQVLVHDSIKNMQTSIEEQFKEIETAISSAVRSTLTPALVRERSRLAAAQTHRDEAALQGDKLRAAGDAALERLALASAFLSGVQSASNIEVIEVAPPDGLRVSGAGA